MQVIDIEARNAPRYQPPQVSFRRTEADRRPARVVLRPQDGPGDWECRQALARQRLAEANRKSIVIEGKPMSSVERARAQRQAYKMAILTRLAACTVGMQVRDVAEAISVNYDMTSKMTGELAEDGLLKRVTHGRRGGGRSCSAEITDAGLALLDANP